MLPIPRTRQRLSPPANRRNRPRPGADRRDLAPSILERDVDSLPSQVYLERNARPSPSPLAQRIHQMADGDLFRHESRRNQAIGYGPLRVAGEVESAPLSEVDSSGRESSHQRL